MRVNESKNDARTIALKIGAVVLVTIMLISLALFLWEIREKKLADSLRRPEKLEDTLSYKGENYVLKDRVETLLVLGLDKFDKGDGGSYNNNKQADFLLLFVFDNAAQTCKAIHINRDSMVEMNVLGVAGDKIGTETKQIALSHTYGNGREVSCRNAANAVSGMLMGVEIDHYVSIVMEAVPIFNDMIGGVTLEVLDDFTGIDDTLVKGETVTLLGNHALYYVRSRAGLDDASNNNRMRRQKQYLETLFDQTRKAAEEDSALYSRIALEMTDYIVSDCSGNKLEALLKKVSAYNFDTVLSIDGKNVKGKDYMEFYPDEHSVKEIVIDCFYNNVEK
ncbi:MAG: LCP family protein [Clostridia bacterium]|nr:LCP family protein [Clostridia bacterium]